MALTLEEKRKERLTAEWEGLCDPRQKCGTACCFHEGSPCEELKWIDKKQGVGICKVYEKRQGLHKTIDGKEFMCVNASTWIKNVIPPTQCGYNSVISVDGVCTKKGLTQ